MTPHADELDEIRFRLRVSNLEARIELREIEASALAREIRSPLTSALRRTGLTHHRIAIHGEISQLKAELEHVRRSFPLWARH